MSYVQWPATLPDKVDLSGFGLDTASTVIETEMEVGPPKKRKTSTTENDTMSISFVIKNTDYSTMDLFFKNTLAGGSIPFEFNHPITQVPTVFEFIGEPSYAPVGGLNWRVSGSWRMLYAVP